MTHDFRHADQRHHCPKSAYCCCRHRLRRPGCDDDDGHHDVRDGGAGCCPYWTCPRCHGFRCRWQWERRLPLWQPVRRDAICRLLPVLARRLDGMQRLPCPCPCRQPWIHCAGWKRRSCPRCRRSCGCDHCRSCARYASTCLPGLGPDRILAGNGRMICCHPRPCRWHCRRGCFRCGGNGLYRLNVRKRRACGCCSRECVRRSCGANRSVVTGDPLSRFPLASSDCRYRQTIRTDA